MLLIFPILWLLFLCSMVVGGGYVVVRFLRAYERRIGSGAEPASLAERVTLLERTVERMERELEQVGEGQRFMNQLLAGRTASLPGGAESSESSESSSHEPR
jgi:hypothetical protein